MTSGDRGCEPDSFHWDWDRDSGTQLFSHPVELLRFSSRVLLPLGEVITVVGPLAWFLHCMGHPWHLVHPSPSSPCPILRPTQMHVYTCRAHTHTHAHTHIWCYLGHRGVVPCDILHMPVEHSSPTKHSPRQSGTCICMRCQIINVANKTAEGECQELTNICNKVVENQIKCHQRYMEPRTPIALFISKE